MNEAKVLTVKTTKFQDDNTGEWISGRQVWLSMATPDPDWAGGVEVFKAWCQYGGPLYDFAGSLRPGDAVLLSLSRKGKVCDMVLA